MYHILAFFHICSTRRIAPVACGAHDCGMVAPKRRFLNRGFSVLAAFVFVSILGWTALAVSVALPQQYAYAPLSMTAAPPASTLAEDAGTKDINKEKEVASKQIVQKCALAIAACQKNPAGCAAATNKKSSAPGGTDKDDCVAAFPDKSEATGYKCVGKSATTYLLMNYRL